MLKKWNTWLDKLMFLELRRLAWAYDLKGLDPCQEYYDELATPPAHMRKLARKKIGLMSDMP